MCAICSAQDIAQASGAAGASEPTGPPTTGDQIWAFREQPVPPPPQPVKTQTSFQPLPVTREDPDDEESDMIKTLAQLSGGKLQVGKKTTQKQKKKGLTLKQINKIAQDINTGKIQLPDVSLDSNAEWDVLLSLVDSGSSVHAVNVEKVFAGAKIQKAPNSAKPFKVANGGTVPNLGSAAIQARTAEGNNLTMNWKHAPVDMPILSTKLLTHGGKALWYHETGGSIVDPNACSKSDFIEAGGVYLLKLLVPKSLTQKGHPPPSGPPPQSGFVWPGAVA